MAIYIWDVMAAEFGSTDDVAQVALGRLRSENPPVADLIGFATNGL